jgi:large subunit ribosomal protein L17
MRHQRHRYKLGVNPAHRKALMKNLASEVIDHGKIKTTHAKAKATQIYVEKLITLAKTDTVANRRLAFARLNNKNAVSKLFAEVAPKFKERNGGYTRVIRTADRRVGDGSDMSFISLVD